MKVRLLPLMSVIASAALLQGCFQNVSGTNTKSSSSSSSQSQSSFSDTGASSTTPGGFNGSSFTMSTAEGGIVGSFAATGTGETSPYLGNLGLMLNLRIPLLKVMDEATLNTLLNSVDNDVNIQNIDVTLKIPQFHIQVAFKFGKIAAGNSKRLRNVMVIRPLMAGIDLSTGYVPDSAPVLQLPSTNIMTYGGLFEGTPILRVTHFNRSLQVSGQTGFLPNPTNPTWGEGYPGSGIPQANAIFRTLTPKLATIFSRLPSIMALNQPEFAGVASSPSNYALAIHRDTTAPGGIGAAWIIYPTQSVPIMLLLCAAEKNDFGFQQVVGSVTYDRGSEQACNCAPGVTALSGLNAGQTYPSVAGVFEPCKDPATLLPSQPLATSTYAVNKLPYLLEAIATKPTNPSTGYLALPTVAISGFTVSILP